MERNAQHAFDAEEVMAYLDGELEARRAAALAAHLVSCSECQEVAQGFRALSERMLSFEVEHPSARTTETVLAALHEAKLPAKGGARHEAETKPWNWRDLFARRSAWAIAGAVIVVMILIIGIPGRQGSHKPATPVGFSRLDLYAKLEPSVSTSQTVDQGGEPAPPPPPGDELKAPENVGQMIVQTASLNILATNYDEASAAIEKLAAAHGGYVEKLGARAHTGNARALSATLRIPTKQLEGFLADVRKLGHVEEETRSNEEVSDQYVDLQARLKSARATEQRLIELLGTRTGKLQDVLEAERELARIRGEIEGMQGQSAILVHRVNYATVQVDLSEEYRRVLGSGPISTGTKIRNAAVEGFTNLEEGAVALVVFVFAVGPSLLFWLAILLLPGWFIWKRFRVRARS
jgi:Domain of unknown function (DUF4349)/Putative zinc-finger